MFYNTKKSRKILYSFIHRNMVRTRSRHSRTKLNLAMTNYNMQLIRLSETMTCDRSPDDDTEILYSLRIRPPRRMYGDPLYSTPNFFLSPPMNSYTFSGGGRFFATLSLFPHRFAHAASLGHSFSALSSPNHS